MANLQHPKDKILVMQMGGVKMPGSQTNAEVHLAGLSAEVLRDLARNEAASKEWRKAAVELLIKKQHAFANHPELRELAYEIKAEEDARIEVEALAHQHEYTYCVPLGLEEIAKEILSPETEQPIDAVKEHYKGYVKWSDLLPETEQSTLDMAIEGLDAFNKATEDKRVFDNGLPKSEGKQIKFFQYDLKPETPEELADPHTEDTELIGK